MKPRGATKGSPKHNRHESLFNTVTKVVTENAADTRGQSSRSQITLRGSNWENSCRPRPVGAPLSPRVRALSPATPLRRRPMVRVTDGLFSSAAHGGAKIFSRAWCPEGAAPPRAVLVWSHGIHEHLGRFERLYARLAEAGRHGHGASLLLVAGVNCLAAGLSLLGLCSYVLLYTIVAVVISAILGGGTGEMKWS